MKIVLLVVGKTVEKHFNIGIDDYVSRIKHYAPFEITVVPDLKNTKNMTFEQQKEKEADLILAQLQQGDTVILLDENGKEFKSLQFSEWIEKKMNTSPKRLVFVIGGPYGFAPRVYERAHDKISLSRMTFSHQMVRLVFVEQLYRAFNILKGGSYHHE